MLLLSYPPQSILLAGMQLTSIPLLLCMAAFAAEVYACGRPGHFCDADDKWSCECNGGHRVSETYRDLYTNSADVSGALCRLP